MEFLVLGWPEDDVTLRLDYRQFSYAGKFVMSNTGKAVVRVDDEERARGPETGDEADEFDRDVLAAVAFNEDRTDSTTLWIRYVTVRQDRRGDGLGPKLAAFLAEQAREQGYDRLRIAVNNPFAYEALYKAGFAYTGRQTGLAELVLEREFDGETVRNRSRETYQSGLDAYRERDLGDDERSFLESRADADPPETISAPESADV
ncbi:acetyltransferase [Haloprofundus marisrubri]|uniref:Acetyltransferase n=1 Tax=Haloprofundus marisrubri TaxID=1514971 RepID=A0A0W1R526_9EURY|nr:GNAT family N-acetyltransferase [Haloprofundus marisrubri]KTG08332.1 acetyltransferase [Haloprofundus marisrubri]